MVHDILMPTYPHHGNPRTYKGLTLYDRGRFISTKTVHPSYHLHGVKEGQNEIFMETFLFAKHYNTISSSDRTDWCL